MILNVLASISEMNIEDVMPFVWLIVFVIAVIAEFASAELVSVWFIFASLIALGLSFIPGLPFFVEIIVFVVLSAVQIIFLRKIFKKLFKTKEFRSNSDSMIDEKVLVVKDIVPNELGEIKHKGIIWSAYADEEIKSGEYVIVESIDGNRLKVRKEN